MAVTLRLLSAGSIRRGVSSVIEWFGQEHGVGFDADFTSAPRVRDRILAGEAADVVIASSGALDTLAQASKIVASSRVVAGRTGMAVAMRTGATVPDLSGAEAFRRAMLGADLLAYNQGSSGIHAAALVDRLGLREALGAKIREVRNGAEMFGLIAGMPGNVVGLANVTNILDQVARGAPVMLAARLPDALQNVTTYEVAVAAGTREAALAGAFVRCFTAPEARRRLAAAGVEQDG